MSLSREELESLYQSAKKIQRLSDYLIFHNKLRANEIRAEAQFIKTKIEQVIGQQE